MHAMLAYILAMGLAMLALAAMLIAQGLAAIYPEKAKLIGRWMLSFGIALSVLSLAWLGLMLWRYFSLLAPDL